MYAYLESIVYEIDPSLPIKEIDQYIRNIGPLKHLNLDPRDARKSLTLDTNNFQNNEQQSDEKNLQADISENNNSSPDKG